MAERKLKNWITGYEEYMEESETPNLFKTWTAISVLCSVLQRKCWHTWEKKIYPNMYIVLVGPSGSRKGTAMYPAEIILEYTGTNLSADATTREALIRALNNSGDEILLVKEGIGIKHSSITIFSSELTVFLGQNNWQLISDLNDWYDCKDNWKYDTKNKGTDAIKGVWVNLLGATTPEFLTTALPNDAIGGGLTARIVFVFADKKSKIAPAPFITPEMVLKMKELLYDIDIIKQLQGEFKISPEFFDLHTDWYIDTVENPPFDDNTLEKYCERRSLHLRKLAMAHSVACSSDMILTEQDFIYASTLLFETEKYMPFAFSGKGRHPSAWVIDQIQKMVINKGAVSYRKIVEHFMLDATKQELDEYIRKLVFIKLIQVMKRGDETFLVLNPDWRNDIGGGKKE